MTDDTGRVVRLLLCRTCAHAGIDFAALRADAERGPRIQPADDGEWICCQHCGDPLAWRADHGEMEFGIPAPKRAQTPAEIRESVRLAGFFEEFERIDHMDGAAFAADARDPDWRDTPWRPLRWERPRIVSSSPKAPGTPKPQGWEQ